MSQTKLEERIMTLEQQMQESRSYTFFQQLLRKSNPQSDSPVRQSHLVKLWHFKVMEDFAESLR